MARAPSRSSIQVRRDECRGGCHETARKVVEAPAHLTLRRPSYRVSILRQQNG